MFNISLNLLFCADARPFNFIQEVSHADPRDDEQLQVVVRALARTRSDDHQKSRREVEGERPSERTPADGRRNRQSRFAAEHRLNAIADDAASSRRTEEIAQANRHHLTASSLRFCCLSNYVPCPLPLSNSTCLHIPIYSLH